MISFPPAIRVELRLQAVFEHLTLRHLLPISNVMILSMWYMVNVIWITGTVPMQEPGSKSFPIGQACNNCCLSRVI